MMVITFKTFNYVSKAVTFSIKIIYILVMELHKMLSKNNVILISIITIYNVGTILLFAIAHGHYSLS